MKQNLTALELHYITKELQFLIDSRLDKVYAPSKKELLLQFFAPSRGKFQIRVMAGKFMYLTEYKPEFDEASGFCMYLRKQLLGNRLRKIEQKGFERIVEFEFENESGKKSLFIELFGKGNLILVKDEIILSAAEQQKWADRSVMPKEKYVYPTKDLNLLTMSELEFRDFCKNSKQESIVKTLAMELGLGKTYAEEACLNGNIDKDSVPTIGRIKLEALYKTLLEFRSGNKGFLYKNGTEVLEISPIPLKTYAEHEPEVFDSYNAALDHYFTKLQVTETEDSVKLKSNAELDKLKTIVTTQKHAIENLQKEEELNRAKAEMIYTNYTLIGEIFLQMRDAVKKYPVEEIMKRLKGQMLVKSYTGKNKSIVVDLK
jgi:predicted ribosome quality control (RQC) complex YloA/Tae2 family protein